MNRLTNSRIKTPESNQNHMDAILTFDIGGTFIRSALFDLAGRLLCIRSAPSKEAYLDAKGNEADPDLIWETIRSLAEAVFHEISEEDVRLAGIVSCGMTRTQIFLDEKGQSVRPAITFRDSRAESQAQRLAGLFETGSKQGNDAKPSPLSAYHPLARLMWLKDHEPDAMAHTRWVLQPKDYIAFRLTGTPPADAISSASFSVGDGAFPSGSVFQTLGLKPGLVPTASSPESMVGHVKPDAPFPFGRFIGAPVFNGSMDAWCGTLGIGAVRPGYGYNITGTTESLGLVCPKPVSAPGLLSLPWGNGLHQIGGPSQAGGDCLAWLLNSLRPEAESASDRFQSLKRLVPSSGPPAPIFLPYLAGERVPLWNPKACGVFFGLRSSHKQEDLIRSVMEGVAFANRHILELAEKAAQQKAQEVRVTGGAAKLDAWCQIKADVMGRPVVRTRQEEAGLFGAALLAILGLGEIRDFDALQAELVQEERRFLPDPGKRLQYKDAYRLYRNLIKQLSPCFESFSNLGSAACGEKS